MDFKALVKFLSSLKKNNNKEWFDKNRKEYEVLRKDWIGFVGGLIKSVGAFDKDVMELDPKKCIFRINRDIRFSADKSPYKTNFGASLSKSGEKMDFCGYYLHVQPGEVFLAGGSYMPMPEQLQRIRQEIDYNLDEFKKIVSDKNFKKQFGQLSGDKLQRPPKGYDAENPAVEFLKHKGFLAYQKFDEKKLYEKDFEKYCSQVFKAMLPLNEFLNRAVRD